MNIKNKVMLSNIVIIVVLILMLMVILGISIKSTEGNYHEALETLIKDKTSIDLLTMLI